MHMIVDQCCQVEGPLACLLQGFSCCGMVEAHLQELSMGLSVDVLA